jgi:3-phenylpropionate/trans-cinnamate dioxygenase ferredoxin component
VSDQLTGPGFVRVCRLDELPEVGAALAEIDGRRIALVRTEDGGVHSVDDTCSHANVSLAEGELDGCTLECWLHGSRFDLRTGEPTGPPAVLPIAVHTVRIVGDDVHVAITGNAPVGEPAHVGASGSGTAPESGEPNSGGPSSGTGSTTGEPVTISIHER